jgi:AbrB family looped-hinge helix DNA binding protein
MEVIVSSKYQLVVPKEVRKQLGIKPGQKVRVKQVSGNTITFERQPTMQELLDKSAGTMKDTPWQKKGVDAAAWIRRIRDEEWS